MEFEILGQPTAKGRPRYGKWGVYTPTKTVNYETYVKWLFANKFGEVRLECPVKVEITAIFEVPKSYSNKKRQALLGQPYTHKPDVDNLTKIILDALNKLAYKDDALVCESIIRKKYGEESKVIIKVEEINWD